ncbi:DUF5102 domain-containing protein [Aspergillus ruber CBS 135680]|uniref:Uncharacterized protein n=1 Tax=Aspergillus ruber (strain CBS 135680) TaxID=1388766 RepID=A0A017SP33_ASPRC|nr:uncharacterized protein EURHEDRAFT_400182 [Aspergillus ruber CBS 135680]EYE98020.1 hypothetical protein EURHEDRAFT_400182 [Aspergillus ruber CBS 135680]
MPENPPNSHLEPPQKSVELEDPGAQESAPNSDDEDHFSDASEGNPGSHSRTASGHASPIPRTRVEKVDDNPSHGEVPGTAAYGKRGNDSVPDEVEVIPEGSRSRSQSTAQSPSENLPVPRTVVERVDPEHPSHGDVPGTDAYDKRRADAVPDVVTTAPESGGTPELNPEPEPNDAVDSTAVPETVVSQVETPTEEESESRPRAHRRRPSDALPDSVETVPDAPDLQSSPATSVEQESSAIIGYDQQKMDGENNIDDNGTAMPGALPEDEDDAVDDFDDFAEEQEEMGDDDFGDFDGGFQEPEEVVEAEAMYEGASTPAPQPPTLSVPPLIDFDTIQSLPDLHAALEDPLNRLFPTSKNTTSLPPVQPIENASAIFHTDRSLSLWSQLVAPPPLQPQNWVKSRIRRLFLVSLGVPVDLDEILPASKQKKLVLPGDTTTSTVTSATAASTTQSSTTTSTAQQQQTKSTTSYSRSRQPQPPPDLDLSSVGRLCSTTDAALSGLTDPELQSHVDELHGVTQTANAVLEYWLKRYDELVKEKEAFEGVIENLVSHARRVRK